MEPLALCLVIKDKRSDLALDFINSLLKIDC